MYGKHFSSMYEGSMYGAGLNVFAVWGYVISNMHNGVIELNPVKLAHTLGGQVEDIQKAIEYLGSPDPSSRNKDDEGRRIIKQGQFQYYVSSWKYYRDIRNEIDRREYNRLAQARHRLKSKLTKKGKELFDEAVKAGAGPAELDEIARANLKGPKIPKSHDQPSSAAFKSGESAALAAAERGDMETHDRIMEGR